jgi:ferredoxin
LSKDKRKLLLCNCNKTMTLDAKALAQALELDAAPHVNTELCRRHLASFESAAKSGEELLVACTQEAPLFSEVGEELKSESPIRFVNIRETAGWSAEAKTAGPKIAALLALAGVPEPEPVAAVSYASQGRVLIVGPGAAALGWADRLNDPLVVSVLITDGAAGYELPVERKYAVFSGKVNSINGYLGNFEVTWEQANPIDLEVCTRCNACIRTCPENAIDYTYQIDMDKCRAHRLCVKSCGEVRAIDFERADKARAEQFDLVLDLAAEPAIKLHQLPQGYFAPGRDPLEQALAAGKLAQLRGEFEKPRFFNYKEKICAHSRSEIVGCTKCIDVCSSQAIHSEVEENRVSVDPHLCAGCGGCATVCPSGAMTYAYPRMPDMGVRLKTVLHTYRKAGGKDACLLFHNGSDGRDLIARVGRAAKGLPARVVPLEVFHVGALGLDLMLGSVALGAAQVAILAAGSEAPEYVEALRFQMRLANEIVSGLGLGAARFQLIEAEGVAALEQTVWGLGAVHELKPATFNLSEDKRTTLDFAFDHLARIAAVQKDEIALPAGAPFGAVVVNRKTCTLCMACVGACPESALLDAKESPKLKFIERNCVQCGLCEKTCPEDAITLLPRLSLSKTAKAEVVLNEAEVFACVKCGKPFATKQMVDNMLAKLGTHSMFAETGALDRLKMCADCRAIDLLQSAKHGSIQDY